MHIPSSTYRVQLHRDFNFRDLHRILEYLYTLGISTIYASPITQAIPGSMHGYDVTDPHTINPELGTVEELRAIVRELHKKDIHWLQDIVPNHMAYHTDNFRLMDVLERGSQSPYYTYFDIDWNHPAADLNGKVMAPFLGSDLETCVANGEVKLCFGEDGFNVCYFETGYPLSLSAYAQLSESFGNSEERTALPAILTRMIAAAEGVDYETWSLAKREFVEEMWEKPETVAGIGRVIDILNRDTAHLLHLLDQQYYHLCFWKETDKRINYRRFFTVNELICLRMEDENVFEDYHTFLLKLYKEKIIKGFRIDHIDGLQDPAGYTRALRKMMGDACYIIAEKILEMKEDMPAHWPLQGTSGYEFLSVLNQLLTNRKGAKELLAFYQHLLPDLPPYRKLIFRSKKLILENYLSGEWENLTRLFGALNLSKKSDTSRMKQALGFFMLCLPVYRIYPERLPVREKSLLILHEAIDKALKEAPDYGDELNELRTLFTSAPEDEDLGERILIFLRRLMQFTGPLTAKGVEDTTFYIYNPLISHDEVGDSPLSLGISVQRFHEKMQARAKESAYSLNATATHDTKRGEDARVRLNVLSRLTDQWKEHVSHWLEINKPMRSAATGITIPALNDEYFIYQSMLGGFPEDFQITDEWIERMQSYLNKALREAKVNTSWSDPDEAYEKGCEHFVNAILNPEHTFLASFIPFVKIVSAHAITYSLSQTLIKLTAPGIPDIYQGCELWDLSFVDPDNRRPVDYEKRMEFLFQLVIKEEKGKDAVFDYLAENREAGIEKLYATWKTLNVRKSYPLLFSEGDYIPISISGGEVNAAAYARNRNDDWVMVIFPFGLEQPATHAGSTLVEQHLILPEAAPQVWTHTFTGETIDGVNQIPLARLFAHFPVALLVGQAFEREKSPISDT